MGLKTSSGFYLSRTSAALLALLLAVLLLALIIVGAMYARTKEQYEEKQPTNCISNISNISSTSATLETPTGRSGIWDNPRLPHILINITIKCINNTDIVLLHSNGLNFSRVARETKPSTLDLDGISSLQENDTYRYLQSSNMTSHTHPENVTIKNVWTSEFYNYVVIEMDEALVAGNLYVIRFDYAGIMRESSGLFITHYTDFNTDKAVVASLLEPTLARTVYPCFDEPWLKATFKIIIVHNSSYVALSNMPAADTSKREDVDGYIWTVTTFKTTPKMSTYITAFVVCDFDYISTTVRGNEIRIWGRKEMVQKGFADFALNITGQIFSFMEDLLNVSYPLQKTDLVALPELHVAMENWGLITFNEYSVLYDPMSKLSDSKMWTCLIVSHEIAHQWFGNLVTMKWWTDLWMNEGFASYMEYIGANFIDSKLKQNEVFTMHSLQRLLETDVGFYSGGVSTKEEENVNYDFNALFNRYTYGKGAAIIRMMSYFLTEKLFFKGISSYLKTFSFSNADQDDLWDHLQMFIDAQDKVRLPGSLRQIMHSWIWQRGVPLLTLNTSTGELTQEHFQTDKTDNTTRNDNHTWIVPVTWIKNGIEQKTLWLDSKAKIFPEMKIAADEWVVLNINTTGYYRTNYDQENWKRVAQQLESNPEVNRYDYIEYGTAFSLTKYLEKENELIVWYTALKHLMSSEYPLVNYNNFSMLKKYILKRINPIYQRYANMIRRNVKTSEDHFMQKHIEIVFRTACLFGLQDCLQLANKLYTMWMKNSSNDIIPQFIKNTIYCYAIAQGGDKEWDFAWKTFNKSEDKTEYFLLQGMSCTKEPRLLYQ
ncbi:hypothetical protein GDO86_002173 [Hymenochirus boettgeri]|uniref:Aminopeptidase n=1 Tax=Hymenochirus boettgeri TaxID=247094 RepID=A0A8T2KLE7_9PIPI|nr:hypothetical protein GDO86_002173 [Hymenochirus boettgeri]